MTNLVFIRKHNLQIHVANIVNFLFTNKIFAVFPCCTPKF
nr:MAG TPA: hypothetical protein [Caudoviricetes sp.]